MLCLSIQAMEGALITAAQYDRLGQQAWRDFVARASQHVRQDLGNLARHLSDDALAQRIERVTQQAQRYRLLNEDEIVCLLDAGLILGDEGFLFQASCAPLQALLQDTGSSAQTRARQLLDIATQRRLLAMARA